MSVAIYGLGYIGLPTAALIASSETNVIGVDNNKNIIKNINEGKVINFEANLEQTVHKALVSGYLAVTHEPSSADIYVITVPTPVVENNLPDLSYVKEVTKTIAPMLVKGNMVIIESTLPVGGTEKMINWILEERDDLNIPTNSSKDINDTDIHIAYCPERVLPGNILNELISNDRIIGGLSTECANRAQIFYKQFVQGECIKTKIKTAEFCKLVENSFRDVNIAFANELSLICHEEGINVWELIRLANRHPRVDILQPGPGVGGHCIAIDPWFIVDNNPELARIIKMARIVNDSIPYTVISRLEEAIQSLYKPNDEIVIATLGLTYKANVDDTRESPGLEISREIDKFNILKQLVVEPNISNLPDGFNNGKTVISPLIDAISQADIIVLLVDHKEFFEIERSLLSGKIIIDTKGIFDSHE